MKKIDIHAHTSNHALWELHVKTATLADLERYAAEYEIVHIALLATYFPFKQSGLANRELLARIKGNSLFSVFGSLDAMNDYEHGLAELEELAAGRLIAGIKLYPGYQDFSPSDAKLSRLYGLAARHRLPVMFHTGELHHCCSKERIRRGEYRCGDFCRIERLGHLSRPLALLPVAEAHPRVNFVFSHLGNPYFGELREAMTLCPNVYTDISGQFVSGRSDDDTPENRNLVSRELGRLLSLPGMTDRIMFGTDFPIQSYADSVGIVQKLGLGRENEEKIFYRNAAKLLGMEE